MCALVMFYARPKGTTVLISSTTRDDLQRRVWGYVLELDKEARELYPDLPGHFVESELKLLADAKDIDGRSKKDGVMGVACKKGGQWEGLEAYVGTKNEVLIGVFDEAHFMPVGFLDSVANLESNENCYIGVMGNLPDVEVTAVVGSVITLQNLEDTTTGEYANNAAPGTVLPVGAKITPTGWQGPTGADLDPGDFFQVINNLSEGNAITMRGNLGLGSIATYPYGSVAGAVPNIHTTLAAGQSVWFTGVGLETKTAANARTALGLGSVAVFPQGITNGRIPKVDQVGGLTNGEVVFATASGIESVDATTALSRLGISSGGNPPMLLYQHVSAGNGGAFNAGSSQTVPINTEIVDTDSIGSIASNQVTLPAGTYRFRFVVVGNGVDVFVGYLYSVTGGTVVNNAGTGLPTYGTNGYSENGPTPTNSYSHGAGRFTLAASTVIALRAECQSTNGTTGFGIAGGFTPSGNYYYSWLELIKEL